LVKEYFYVKSKIKQLFLFIADSSLQRDFLSTATGYRSPLRRPDIVFLSGDQPDIVFLSGDRMTGYRLPVRRPDIVFLSSDRISTLSRAVISV
jgi:hypothetical protein